MDTLADHLARAADEGRRRARGFPGRIGRDALPFAVLEAFDAEIRGHVERDRRIEDERDRVLIAAVKLAETPPEEGDEAVERARAGLIDALDYLEQAVLRLGIVNRRAAKAGLGTAGGAVGERSGS
ncbi:hypothetical protein [Methylobacterium radiodurans]|uniref:Uncharacterized protein n=1 Tax=Methylobacterium radiodurans TaxID=2202828 RepID=A0A2U8VU22_9HYPH|nr:hypothetical protein [Methylobacterium radiodurans]AWN36900.1 hypothetical protein DK427_15120 [Methylobacterium radiodurans]